VDLCTAIDRVRASKLLMHPRTKGAIASAMRDAKAKLDSAGVDSSGIENAMKLLDKQKLIVFRSVRDNIQSAMESARDAIVDIDAAKLSAQRESEAVAEVQPTATEATADSPGDAAPSEIAEEYSSVAETSAESQPTEATPVTGDSAESATVESEESPETDPMEAYAASAKAREIPQESAPVSGFEWSFMVETSYRSSRDALPEGELFGPFPLSGKLGSKAAQAMAWNQATEYEDLFMVGLYRDGVLHSKRHKSWGKWQNIYDNRSPVSGRRRK